MKLKVVKIVRIISFILLVLFFIGTINLLFPIIKSINTEEGRIVAQDKIKNQGIVGMLFIIIIEILKIFTIFFITDYEGIHLIITFLLNWFI